MTMVCKRSAALCLSILLLSAVAVTEARAQRTMRGESLVTAGVHYPFSNPYWMGVDLSYGRYLLGSFWRAGAVVTEYTHMLAPEIPMSYVHAAAYGDWVYRLWGTRSRVFSVYTGAGVFLGYEAADPWSLIPDSYKEGVPQGTFLYGVRFSLEMEIFLSRRVAVVLGGKVPLNFSSGFGYFHYDVGAGVRLNI